MPEQEWDDVQKEINSGGAGYYAPHKLEVGVPEEIVITSYLKWTQTKYPIKDKAGNSLGYTWRFRLADGRVWDVANRNRKVLLAALHPDGGKVVVPHRFRITNLGKSVDKNPSTKVEPVGAEQVGEVAF